eukprot:GSMAST32.ASY1.ANO1.547.1 assembled CDS
MVKFGIIGCGAMGHEHMRNILLFKDHSVVAMADTNDPSIQHAMSTIYNVVGCQHPTVYTDYHELLNDTSVEAVIICTPNCHHYKVLLDCISTGKHILVEKPMCTTIEHVNDIQKRVENYTGVFWVGMEYRYMPSIARLIKEVDSGSIGKVHIIREHRFPFLKKVGNWNRFAKNTGGTLVEKCCHFFDLFNRIIKHKPIRVYASGSQAINHKNETYTSSEVHDVGTGIHSGIPNILDNACMTYFFVNLYVIVEYENGTRAHLDLCMFAEVSRNQEEICVVGELGKIEAFGETEIKNEPNFYIGKRNISKDVLQTPPLPPEIVVKTTKGIEKMVQTEKKRNKQNKKSFGFHEGSTYYELEHFIHSIELNEKSEVTASDGALAVLIGVAAQKSIEEKRSVTISNCSVIE